MSKPYIVLSQRVKRGVQVLNKHFPTWREYIDLKKLDMSSHTYGILEQLFEPYGYTIGLKELDILFIDGVRYGFDVDLDRGDDASLEWQHLTQVWRNALTEQEEAA